MYAMLRTFSSTQHLGSISHFITDINLANKAIEPHSLFCYSILNCFVHRTIGFVFMIWMSLKPNKPISIAKYIG